jgi:hypothetical protein
LNQPRPANKIQYDKYCSTCRIELFQKNIISSDNELICKKCGTVLSSEYYEPEQKVMSSVKTCDENLLGSKNIAPEEILQIPFTGKVMNARKDVRRKRFSDACEELGLVEDVSRRAMNIFDILSAHNTLVKKARKQESELLKFNRTVSTSGIAFFAIYQACCEHPRPIPLEDKKIINTLQQHFQFERQIKLKRIINDCKWVFMEKGIKLKTPHMNKVVTLLTKQMPSEQGKRIFFKRAFNSDNTSATKFKNVSKFVRTIA